MSVTKSTSYRISKTTINLIDALIDNYQVLGFKRNRTSIIENSIIALAIKRLGEEKTREIMCLL